MSESTRTRQLDRGAFLPVWPTIAEPLAPWWAVLAAGVLLGLTGSVALAWIAVEWGIVVGFAVLVIAIAGISMLADVRAGVWIAVGIVTLLPFAVVPVRVGLTLTALEVASLLVLGVWLARTLLTRDELLPASVPAALMTLFLIVTLFALLLGVGRGYTTQTYHDYSKFVFATLLVFVVWTSIRSVADHRRLLNVALLGGAGAAAIGLVFHALGPGFAERALVRLIPIGYPDSRIVRYIEDDPERQMRLVGTSVDPNSAGGMLAVVFVIAAVQLVSRQRSIPLWLCLPAVPLTGLALLLTYSRGAWLGAAAGLGIAALLRYRWLIPAGLTAIGGLVVFGIGTTFFERLWLGFTLQDPATRLRISEYRNAIEIIREYPFFGVGFGDAPTVELQTGVSSIYLAIAQQTGFLGLAAYFAVIVAIVISGFSWWRARTHSVQGDLMLTLLAALGSALVIGVFDHYFFNIQFPHMAGLLWIVAGAILALSRPIHRTRELRGDQPIEHVHNVSTEPRS